MKEGPNGKPTKIAVNPSTFIQHEVNFMKNIFYDELTLVEEYPIFRISGGSHPKKRGNLEGRQNIAYEDSQDLNVTYKRILNHHFT